MENKTNLWTKDDVLVLNTLRKKKVTFKHIGKVLNRTETACRSKAFFLDHPEYFKNRKRKKASKIDLKKQPRPLNGEMKKLKVDIKVYQNKIRDLIKERNQLITDLTDARHAAVEFSKRHDESEAVIKAIQINIRNYEQRKQ